MKHKDAQPCRQPLPGRSGGVRPRITTQSLTATTTALIRLGFRAAHDRILVAQPHAHDALLSWAPPRHQEHGPRPGRLVTRWRPGGDGTEVRLLPGVGRTDGFAGPRQRVGRDQAGVSCQEVMRWLLALTNTEIAAELGIAVGTVAAHLSAVRAKLKASPGPQAAASYLDP